MTADDDALRLQYQRLLARIEANEGEFRRLGRSVWRVQEDERRRLARDLHDGVGQNLTALKHRLALLGTTLGPEQDVARSRLDVAIALCSATLEDTRQLSRMLRPPILDDLGLEPALRWLVRSIADAGGPLTELQVGALPVLDAELQTLVFRVAQEALNNVAKHADARHATVHLEQVGPTVRLRIEDDGRGFPTDRLTGSGGSGLGGMRERLRLYGGALALESAPGAGTRLVATVPVDAT